LRLSLAETQTIIGPHEKRIVICVLTGMDRYMQLDPGARARWASTPRVRANIINADVVASVDEQFHGVPDTLCVRQRQQFLLYISDCVCLKFKQATGSNLQTQNIPTQQVLKFMTQQTAPPQETFTDFLKPLTNLVVAYRLNASATGIESVYIKCPEDMVRDSWVWPLATDGVRSEPSELTTTRQLAITEPGKPQRRVKPLLPKTSTAGGAHDGESG